MNPNPAMYGEPDSWHDNFSFGGSTSEAAAELKAIKPKVPIFSEIETASNRYYRNSQLYIGQQSGMIPANTPLDKTICGVGAGKANPFQQIGICYNPSSQDNPNLNANINEIIYPSKNPNVNPINGFFFEAKIPSAYAIYGNAAFGRYMNLRGTGPNSYEFLPGGVYNEGKKSQNGNFSIAPFVSYETRSILLAIQVYVANSTSLPEEPTGVPDCTWRSLESWKNNYSDHVITGCRAVGLVFSSYNSSTEIMTYANTNRDSSGYDHPLGWAIADKMSFYYGVGTHNDMYNYALMTGTGGNGEIIYFSPRTGLYRMKSAGFDNVQQDYVGFMGMAQYSNYAVSTNTAIWYQIPYSSDIYDDLLRATATFGCPFTPKAVSSASTPLLTFNKDFIDNDLCLPIITNKGIADGDYTRGADNINNPFINLDNVRDMGYNPTGFDIFVGDKRVRKIYYRGQQIKTAYFADKKL